FINSREQYDEMHRRSIEDPEGFWGEIAREELQWIEPFHTVKKEDLRKGEIEWFLGGKLNVSVNCLDRHLEKNGDKIAYTWEGDEPGENRSVTYRQMYEETCRLANYLLSKGIKKGDRVAIYMGMVPELAVAM